MMQPVVESEKLAIEACGFQGIDDFQINFLDNELSSIESDPLQASPQHEIIDQVLKIYWQGLTQGWSKWMTDIFQMNGLFKLFS